MSINITSSGYEIQIVHCFFAIFENGRDIEDRARFKEWFKGYMRSAKHWVSVQESEAAYTAWRDRGLLAQAEANQLRAQVAALEAQIAIAKAIIKRGADYDLHSIDAECTEEWHGELYALTLAVKRLREPVGLVWQSDGDGERIYSQMVGGFWYEICRSFNGLWYAVLCSDSHRTLITGARVVDASSGKFACEARHAARYREMQGVS